MAVTSLLALATALAASLAAVPVCARLATATGIVDHPGPLKVQAAAVPYLGGLAVMIGVLAAFWTRSRGADLPLAPLAPLGLALCLGVADDSRDLPIVVRLAGELAIGALLAWAVPNRLGAASWLFAVVVTVVLVNGVNLLDGLDSLAAGVVAASSIGFALLVGGEGRTVALVLVGAVVGFLVYNRPPARIYLGDGGSYLLGTALALLVMLAWSTRVPLATSVSCLLLVALPAAEVTWAVIRRRRTGVPLLAGDRGHSYDRLAARGWSIGAIAATAAGTQLVLVLIGLAGAHSGTTGASAILGATAIALLGGAAVAGFLGPLRGRAR